jgi:hypothetical protein
MLAFIALSVPESQRHPITTELAMRLRNKGFSIETNKSSINAHFDVRKTALFIGVITETNSNTKTVLELWHFAHANKRRSLLFIEESCLSKINNSDKQIFRVHPNVVIFNRFDADTALAKAKNKIKEACDTYIDYSKDERQDNALAWILGGVVAFTIIDLVRSEQQLSFA